MKTATTARHLASLLACLALIGATMPGGEAAQSKAQASKRNSAATKTIINEDPAYHFPPSTLFYVEVGDLDVLADQLGGADSLYRVLRDVYEDKEGKGRALPVNPELFQMLLESRMAIGMTYPEFAKITTVKADEFMIGGIARFGTATSGSRNQEFVQALRSSMAPGKSAPKTSVVRGVKVSTYPGAVGSPPFAYALVGDAILFGEPRGVGDIIDHAAEADAPVLATEPGLVGARQRVPGSRQLFAYVNGRPVVRAFNEGFDEGVKGASGVTDEKFLQAFRNLLGIDAFVGGDVTAKAESGNMSVQFALEIDRSRNGLLAALTDPPELAGRSTALMPADTDLYVAAGVDLIRIYDLVLQMLTPEVSKSLGVPPVAETLDSLQKSLGLQIRDELLAAIGSEFAVGVRIPKSRGLVSYQRTDPLKAFDVAAMIEVRNSELLLSLMRQTAGTGGAVEESDVRGVPVWKRGEFAWTFLGGFLVVGETSFVEHIVRSHADAATLDGSPNFSTAGTIPGNAISAVYASPSFIEWGARSIDGKGSPRKSAFPAGLLVSVQKDQSGIYSAFQVPLPNLRELFRSQPQQQAVVRVHDARTD